MITQQPPGRSHSQGRLIATTTIGLLVVVVVTFALLATRQQASVPAALTRVVVGLFENRTGDTSLDVVGRMAEDWLTQGIMRTQLVDVVDPLSCWFKEVLRAGML